MLFLGKIYKDTFKEGYNMIGDQVLSIEEVQKLSKIQLISYTKRIEERKTSLKFKIDNGEGLKEEEKAELIVLIKAVNEAKRHLKDILGDEY